MGKKTVGLHFIICGAFIFLILRIGSIMTNDFYVQTFDKQSNFTLSMPSPRGFIYDCNLKPLVNETPIYNAAILPTPQNVPLILDNSKIEENDLKEILQKSKPFATPINTSEIDDENIEIFKTFERYSSNQLAEHVIGYTDYTGEKGVTGIEKAFDDFLSAGQVPSKITYQIDGVGRGFSQIQPEIDKTAINNSGVVLTLDKDIQAVCERIGGEKIKKGAIVVMDSEGGDLLSVCSFPKYSPNNLNEAVKDSENAPMVNRAFSAVSVGSTFKVLIAAQALMDSNFSDEVYICNGYIDVDGEIINCHKLDGHGEMTLKTALESSCNPYFVNLGLSLNPQDLWSLGNDMGFGKSTKFAEGYACAGGILPTVENLKSSGVRANFSFGQGELLATPIQIAQMMSCVANDGKVPTPNLVMGITNDGINVENEKAPINQIQAIPQDVANTLKEYLVSCVMNTPKQLAKTEGFESAGKTGTAQTGVFKDGEELNNGWFAGFFPQENPKYTIVVLTEEASTGNLDASPIYKEIAEHINYLDSDLAKDMRGK